MIEDDQYSNSVLTGLQVLRLILETIEDSRSLSPRKGFSIRIVDRKNNIYKLSRHDIAEVMSIHVLATLLIPELDKKDALNLKKKKIFHAIEFHGLRCAYVPDMLLPFANLSDNQKGLAEISIHELIRVYNTGRLYTGAENDIRCWKNALERVNTEFRVIKAIGPYTEKNTKRPNQRHQAWYARYQELRTVDIDGRKDNSLYQDIADEWKVDVSVVRKAVEKQKKY